MDLNTLWFMLVAVLFIGYFFLEGFDYGVGILLPFLAKDDQGRRVILNTIGPHWDGNEVWLLTAGGAIFAAFSGWYATLFSGFYLALVLMLVGLIVRGVALEFRSKDENPTWRETLDWLIFAGSLIPALVWGVALANIVKGVPIDASKNYVGGFFNLLNPYALLGGLTSLAGFTLHGAIFLCLKTTDDLMEKAHQIANQLWLPTLVLIFALVIAGYLATDVFASRRGACGRGRGPAFDGLAPADAAPRLGVLDERLGHGVDGGDGFHGVVSACDGVQPQPRLEPDDL